MNYLWAPIPTQEHSPLYVDVLTTRAKMDSFRMDNLRTDYASALHLLQSQQKKQRWEINLPV